MGRFNDAQVRSVILGSRDFRVISFPGAEDVKVAVRLLSEREMDGCRIEAQRKLREVVGRRSWDAKHVVDVDPDLLARLIEREVVRRAFFDPDTIESDDPVPFFDAPEDVAKLDPETMTRLSLTYLEHSEWTSPRLHLSEEDIDELVEDLGKGPAPEVLLHALDASTLRRCVISLACALRET